MVKKGKYTHQGYNLMLQNVQLPFAYLPFAYLHQTQVIPSPSILDWYHLMENLNKVGGSKKD